MSADNTGNVIGWTLQGEPEAPQVLSNKIIFTPPAPGNIRSGIWANRHLSDPAWSAALEFRATGPEYAGGRLQLWLVKKGAQVVGTNSIYSAPPFEGLALVVDTVGGSGGMIRGFLNDGTVDYNNHHSVDSLAFGHCQYSYRNQGRPSSLKVTQQNDNLRVTVDDKLCFETSGVHIPPGYSFGITAATSENPDTFELFKFIVNQLPSGGGSGQSFLAGAQAPFVENTGGAPAAAQNIRQRINEYLRADKIPTAESIPEVSAQEIEQGRQFADLHYRLQSLMKAVGTLQGDINALNQNIEGKHQSLTASQQRMLAFSGNREFPYAQLDAMDRRIEIMERGVQEIKRSIGSGDAKMRMLVEELKREIQSGHKGAIDAVMGGVTSSVPKLGGIALLIFGSQAVLVGCYAYYKRRKAMGPKKYL
jgi:mannose-binding lectin 1